MPHNFVNLIWIYIIYYTQMAFFPILVKVSLFSYDCCQFLWYFDDPSVYFLWAFCYIFLICFSQPHKLPTCSTVNLISNKQTCSWFSSPFLISYCYQSFCPKIESYNKALQLKTRLRLCFLVELSKDFISLLSSFTLPTCKNIMYYVN